MQRPNGTGYLFVGVRLNESAIAMLNHRATQLNQPRREVGRIIGELLGQ